MNTATHSQSGFLGSRTLVSLVLCGAASSILAGTLLAFLDPDVPVKISNRTLTFAERVAYQRAIEEVYWHHRIWPKERPDPKPSLDAVMSQAQLEMKVTHYLRNSQAPEHWQQPITTEQLQAEMERMAQHTRQPEVLRELFEALGNDPFVIAECLARPLLAERLLAGRSAFERITQTNLTSNQASGASAGYTLPTISDISGGCIDDTWTATSTTNAPSARDGHTAVWTGSEMIIWGGGFSNTGGRYDPSTDSWTATNTANAPAGRTAHTAVWTGSEMIVWGGEDSFGTGTGGRYNPVTDSWTATSTANAPSNRFHHTAVWTGSEMIIWGGNDLIGRYWNTGGRYNPSTDSWTFTSIHNVPSARIAHTAVWTNSEMIVWGGLGSDGFTTLNSGGRYNPGTNSWTTTSTTNAPSARESHTAVWTGSDMIVWGGFASSGALNTGGRYNPSTDSWTATKRTNAPSARYFHTAVLAGSEMIIWGGGQWVGNNFIPLNTGGRYNPITGWTATSTTNAPSARLSHTAVWAGSEMIVWGGTDDITFFDTGGRYCAQPGSTPTPTPTPTLTPTLTATPRPTPSKT